MQTTFSTFALIKPQDSDHQLPSVPSALRPMPRSGELFGEDPLIVATSTRTRRTPPRKPLIEIYKKMRPGEPPLCGVEATSDGRHVSYDMRRYDISGQSAAAGHNKKLNIARRITGHKLVNGVADPMTGEVLADAGEILFPREGTMIGCPRRKQCCDRVWQRALPLRYSATAW